AGYYIITVNVSPTATIGNTVIINGASDPVVFGFTTNPNITNNQTNNGGSHTLPLSFISIKAYEKSSAVNVEWKVANELNIDKYFVERSVDGRTFNSIGQTSATGSGANTITYNLPDVRPFAGNNFYRISALSKDGKNEYSAIVKINLGKGMAAISIYPNPVTKNGSLNLQLQNLNKGYYLVTIFDQHGKQVIKQVISHEGGNSVQAITLPKLSAGAYSINVNSNDIKFIKTIVVE
ncbi:MAG: T9SS type A sorting domain-containing protein, partial [Ginsengibacter sp.]